MELFIQQYLLLSRQCPIPGLGTLKLNTQSATHQVAEHSFLPPVWSVEFNPVCKDDDSLAIFVSKINQTSKTKAIDAVRQWVSQFISNTQTKNIYIPGIGKLKKESGNTISFIQDKWTISLPEITARKIVRANAVHQVLVGDTEHSSVYMTEQMQKPKTLVHLPLFWLWALLIALCSCAALAY